MTISRHLITYCRYVTRNSWLEDTRQEKNNLLVLRVVRLLHSLFTQMLAVHLIHRYFPHFFPYVGTRLNHFRPPRLMYVPSIKQHTSQSCSSRTFSVRLNSKPPVLRIIERSISVDIKLSRCNKPDAWSCQRYRIPQISKNAVKSFKFRIIVTSENLNAFPPMPIPPQCSFLVEQQRSPSEHFLFFPSLLLFPQTSFLNHQARLQQHLPCSCYLFVICLSSLY